MHLYIHLLPWCWYYLLRILKWISKVDCLISREVLSDWWLPRIIYIRFCSKSAVLLHRIKNQNIEAKMKSRSWKPLAIYREKPEAYTEGAVWKAPPFWKNGEKNVTGLLWGAGTLQAKKWGTLKDLRNKSMGPDQTYEGWIIPRTKPTF